MTTFAQRMRDTFTAWGTFGVIEDWEYDDYRRRVQQEKATLKRIQLNRERNDAQHHQ